MNKPTIIFAQKDEKDLLDLLIKLAEESSNERVDVMGTPVPMFNISTSMVKIFKAWKKKTTNIARTATTVESIGAIK